MFRRTIRTLLQTTAVAVLIGASAAPAWACPGCKEATSDQSQNLARGYSYSILFMMPIPFIILGSFGGYVYYTVRKRDAESVTQAASVQATQESEAPTSPS